MLYVSFSFPDLDQQLPFSERKLACNTRNKRVTANGAVGNQILNVLA